jgi:hypothetical protein
VCGGNIIESSDWYQMKCVDTSILKGNFEMVFIRHLCQLYVSNQREKSYYLVMEHTNLCMARHVLHAGRCFRMQLGSTKPCVMYQWKIALWKRWNSERITKSVTIAKKKYGVKLIGGHLVLVCMSCGTCRG